MSYVDPVSISALDIEQTEKIAQVSRNGSPMWRGLLQEVLRLSIYELERSQKLSAGLAAEKKAFTKIKRLTARLSNALQVLTPEQKMTLGRAYYGAEINPFDSNSNEHDRHITSWRNSMKSDPRFMEGIAAYINDTAAINRAATAREGTPSRQPGEIGNRHVGAFDFLVLSLVRAAHFCGGRLDAQKESREGSINQLLEVIRSYLPEHLIPRAPSQRRLYDLVKHAINTLPPMSFGEELGEKSP